jgi:predicted anti-sigma-YlaC factor YlaD
MMKTHFSEADLLETYYTQPGESMPVMMHLAKCEECAARYERLDRKMRETAACHIEKPDTFWSRQRMSIQRRIADQRAQKASIARTLRIAAALALAFFLGGAVVYKTVEPNVVPPSNVQLSASSSTPVRQPSAANRQPNEDLLLHDAWQSDELKEFHSVVQWESWADAKDGGQS